LADVSWNDVKRIGKKAGLAKRSWMWGLAKLGAKQGSRAIPGASRVYAITGEKVNGYIKENRIKYITKILPSGWAALVEHLATNKIFKQAAMAMERKWRSAMRRVERVNAMTIRSLFRSAA